MTVHNDKKEKKMPGTGAILRVYWQHAKKYRLSLVLALLGSALIQVGMLAAPLYLKQFFNLLAVSKPDAQTASKLISILAVVTALWLFEWAMRRLQEWAVMRFETYAMRDLSESAFNYLLDHSYNFFTSNFAGSITHKVSKFSRSFERLADAMIFQFFATFLFVLGAIVVLYLRHPALGIALAIGSIAFIWFQVVMARWRQHYRIAASEADTRVTATLADAIGNQSTIALFAAGEFERKIFTTVVNDWRKLTAALWVADGWIWTGIGFFMVVIETALLYIAIHYWQLGLLTIGDFVLIQAYLMTTFDRLISINRELRGFFSALADGGEMVAILELPHEIQDVAKAKKLKVATGEIVFRDVGFNFHSEKKILEHFDLKVVGGERVALVGPSGAGKSTITKLLLRLFDVGSGAIEIDGQNIAKVTQESLRNAISFVPQEPVLFHRTLMDNIRYGKRDATDAEVLEAAKKAHCHEFISGLAEGYETFVGERGIKLSGGERQRVAIARAILKNSPILVLDEATSSLDSESESLIQDALATLMQGKTVIVIAHRLSTIMKMDRIVVLEGGRVVASGTHDELLAHGGLYHKLWSIQAGGFIADTEPDESGLAEQGE
ncbi:MAG: ABC transporter ATP-binding protein [bacterium]